MASSEREELNDMGTRLTQLEMVVWGIDKQNGLRSVVAEQVRKLAELIARLNHYIDAEREATCVGMAEFAKRDAFKAEIQEEVSEVESAKINAKAQVDVGKIQAWTNTITQLLVLAGVVFVAVFK